MYEINYNVVYVKGGLNGAIYDFNTKNVYSINNEACNIIDKLVKPGIEISNKEKKYIDLLSQNGLFDNSFEPRQYMAEINKDINLSLVWLEITESCNLKCVHCYEGDVHKSLEKSLEIDRWKEIVDELVELKVPNVVVIGGEPCSNNRLNELLLHLSEYEIDTTLFTNATILSEELKKTIIDNDIKVKVSIYGHKAEVHDYITKVKGSFDSLVNNVKYLVYNGVTIHSAVVAMKENQEYLNEIKIFIEKLGVQYRGYDVIRNVFGGQQSEHTPDKSEIIDNAKITEPSFTITKEKFNMNYYKNSCWYGKFAIKENGDVIPCVFERSTIYGNVSSKGIKEVLNSEVLYDCWFKDFSKINTCKACEYRFACKDCRPLGISVCGDINEKNPRCLYNPYTGEWKKEGAKD